MAVSTVILRKELRIVYPVGTDIKGNEILVTQNIGALNLLATDAQVITYANAVASLIAHPIKEMQIVEKTMLSNY